MSKKPNLAPTVSAAVVSDVVTLLHRKGKDPRSLFEQVGLDFDAARDPYNRIEFGDYAELLALAAKETETPHIGLELGTNQDPSKWGAIGYLALNSPTIGSALRNMVKFLKTAQSDTYLRYRNRNGVIVVEYSLLDDNIKHREHDAEFSISYFKNVVDRISEYPVKPLEISFEHQPLCELPCYKRMLGVTPQFGQPTNGITYPQFLANRTVPSADLFLFPVIKRHLEEMAANIPQDGDLATMIKHHIKLSLPNGQSSLPSIARRLLIEPRTLQRRLKSEGSGFAELLQAVRKEQAFSYLQSPTTTISEVSYLLGYSDTSVFIKAFKTWTGMTPSDYRNSISG